MKIYFLTIILILKTFLLSQTGVEAGSQPVCTQDYHCVQNDRKVGSDVLVCRTINGENQCVPSGGKITSLIEGKPG